MTTPPTLTAEQRQVVEASLTARRVVIIATAGAGKTTTLIERAAFLVTGEVPPGHLQFLTFTRAAARELSTRLEARHLKGAYACTLHSFARRVLQRHGETVTPLSEAQHLGLLHAVAQRALPHYTLDPDWAAGFVSTRIRRLRQGDTGACVPAPDPQDQRILNAFDLALDHLRMRHGESLCTHDEVITRCQTFLETHPEALKHVRNWYRFLFIDEFQDVSPGQGAFIELLAGDHQLLIVGDPAQAIFSFQGGTPDLLQQAAQTAQERFELSHNHRCPASHLELAARLLEHREGARPVVARRGFRYPVEVQTADHPAALATQLCAQVRQAVREHWHATILVRSRREVQKVTRVLREDGHLVSTAAGGRGQGQNLDAFTRQLLLPAVHVLHRRHDPRGELPLLLSASALPGQLARSERRLLTAAWQAALGPQAVVEALGTDRVAQLSDSARFVLHCWSELASWKEDSAPALHRLLVELATHHGLELDAGPSAHLCREQGTVVDLTTLLSGHSPQIEQAPVLVSTIHGAKGLEWPAVILTEFPGERSPPDTEEERRLRYVAMTRATQRLAAVLPVNSHPAYRIAFDRRTVMRVHQLRRVLTTPVADWRREDVQLLIDQYHASGHFARYLTEIWGGEVGRPAAARARELLHGAGLRGLPELWGDEEGNLTGEPRPPARVRRIPIRRDPGSGS